MVTPEIDDYIKKTTQIKNPVYFRKLRSISAFSEALGGETAVSPLNQNENVIFILITDIILSLRGNPAVTLQPFKELTYSQNTTILFNFFTTITPDTFYFNNIYHLVQSENFICQVPSAANSSFSVGYIRISQKT